MRPWWQGSGRAFVPGQVPPGHRHVALLDLAVHGHAHSGIEHGTTPGGIPVRNVALPVIGCAYRVYVLGDVGERDVAMAGWDGRHERFG